MRKQLLFITIILISISSLSLSQESPQNILVLGGQGYGKSRIANEIMKIIDNDHQEYFPIRDETKDSLETLHTQSIQKINLNKENFTFIDTPGISYEQIDFLTKFFKENVEQNDKKVKYDKIILVIQANEIQLEYTSVLLSKFIQKTLYNISPKQIFIVTSYSQYFFHKKPQKMPQKFKKMEEIDPKTYFMKYKLDKIKYHTNLEIPEQNFFFFDEKQESLKAIQQQLLQDGEINSAKNNNEIDMKKGYLEFLFYLIEEGTIGQNSYRQGFLEKHWKKLQQQLKIIINSTKNSEQQEQFYKFINQLKQNENYKNVENSDIIKEFLQLESHIKNIKIEL